MRWPVSNPCVIWCSDCGEGFCIDCTENHSLANATKGHTTLPITEYQKLRPFIEEIKHHCEEHDEKFTVFCTTHEKPCCGKCLITNHKDCKDIKQIEDIVTNVKSSSRFEQLESILDEMSNNLKQIITKTHENMAEISNSKTKIEIKIRDLRAKINAHLDDIQDKLITELNTAEEKSNAQNQNIITALTKPEIDIQECHAHLITIKKYASDLQTYLGMKQLEERLSKNKELIKASLENETVHNTEICCQFEDIVENFTQRVQFFGAITIVTMPCMPVYTQDVKQAQMIVPISRSNKTITLVQKKKLNIKSECLVGVTVLPNGTMVFASEQSPGCLIVVNIDGLVACKIPIKAFDVACVDEDTIAVTSKKQSIDIVKISSQEVVKCIPTTFACSGIAYRPGELIYCAVNKGLETIRLSDGQESTLAHFEFSCTSYVTVHENKLFFSDRFKGIVACCDMKGVMIWTFKDQSVLNEPHGLSVDDDKNVFVVGYKSNNVVVISSDGKNCKQLCQKDSIQNPSGVFYDPRTKCALVVKHKGGAVIYAVTI